MARRKKAVSAGGVIAVAALAVIGLLASISKEAWLWGGGVAAISVALYFWGKSKNTQATAMLEQQEAPAQRQASNVCAGASRPASSSGFRIPTPPKGGGTAKWHPAGTTVEMAGRTIRGGLVYVGSRLPTPGGGNDPCLIDPSKPVDAQGDFTERQTQYWPSYSNISSAARAAYLDWLASGRRDPNADVGYVFLFFYGLEHRVILDVSMDAAARADWPSIEQELHRLLAVYGPKSGSFRRYAGGLLSWVQLGNLPDKLYERPLPELERGYELPLRLRVALGQAAADGVPIPPHMALAWLRHAPDVSLRMPAIRCREEFAKIFTAKYTDMFGAGMRLPRNRTKLKFAYQPASAGLSGYDGLKLSFGDIPDVTVLTAPMRELRDLAEVASTELDAYSRFMARTVGSSVPLEGLLLLPATLWPEKAQKALGGLKTRMGSGMVTLSCQDLLDTLEAKSTLTRERFAGFARALESVNIGMEPDILGGAKAPKPEDKVVLFAVPPGEPATRSTPAYQAALVTLQLASTVAAADGDFGAAEISFLRKQIQSWEHVTPNHQRRLMAHLRLLSTAPASLPALKKQLEPLGQAAKETIAEFMASVAQADGTVTPTELKMLEKVYKALGVDSKKVFSAVHAAASTNGPVPQQATSTAEAGFKLDVARIAALQKDSERVSSILANIFKGEQVPEAASDVTAELASEGEAVARPPSLLGLDKTHATFARLLLSRPEWSREELMDVCADLELMLDGALEQLNDASFDKLDVAFTDGEDPVKINNEVLEKLET